MSERPVAIAARRLRTYDHWKATDPQDEWLGPEPLDRDDTSEFCEPVTARIACRRS
jgi:hypothetical protein